jgi:dephospho-CoA kinase
MFAGKPIIGIVGGIGSGKSHVARLFGQLGCLVIDSDAQVRDAYRDPRVVATLKQWWGDAAFHPDGSVDRSAIAAEVFTHPDERRRLEALLHPMVHAARERAMAAAADPAIVAFVWDTPLLIETGLHRECDAVVFVDAPLEVRLERVRATRGWDAAELARREKSQHPLDRKREISDHLVRNTADAGPDVRGQVRDVLSRILAAAAAPKRPPADPPANAG